MDYRDTEEGALIILFVLVILVRTFASAAGRVKHLYW